jgi:uncharacterized protein with von Willebrand factor type A (vWA) domain
MLDEIEDVNSESSPEEQTIDQQPAAPETSQEEPSQSAAPEQKSEDNVPFHMHPRFRELVDERNQFKEQNKAFENQLAELQKQLQSLKPPQQPQKDALMERLKGIDPEFADRFGKLNEVDSLKQDLAEFKQWKENLARQEVVSKAENLASKFYEENKVPAELRKIYEVQWRDAARQDTRIGLNDLPKVLKSIHDDMSKLFENVKRETTKEYVASKKTDASKPSSQPKGQPVKTGKQKYSENPNEAKAQMVKNILAEIRADQDI